MSSALWRSIRRRRALPWRTAPIRASDACQANHGQLQRRCCRHAAASRIQSEANLRYSAGVVMITAPVNRARRCARRTLNSTLRSDRFRGRSPAIVSLRYDAAVFSVATDAHSPRQRQNTAQLACESTARLDAPTPGLRASSTWGDARRCSTAPCDACCGEVVRAGDAVPVNVGSLGHAVRRNELKSVRVSVHWSKFIKEWQSRPSTCYPASRLERVLTAARQHSQAVVLRPLARLGHGDPRGRAPCRAHSV